LTPSLNKTILRSSAKLASCIAMHRPSPIRFASPQPLAVWARFGRELIASLEELLLYFRRIFVRLSYLLLFRPLLSIS
jgi:hypothetical protein